MRKMLLVQINKVDRFILQNIIDVLLERKFNVNIFPEIFHVSINAYDWNEDKYISDIVLQKFQNRFSNFPFDIIIGITDIDISNTNNYYIKTNNIIIIPIKNIFNKNNINLSIERINKIIFYVIGMYSGIDNCKNYCIMRGFKNMEELDSLPLDYCDSCMARIK